MKRPSKRTTARIRTTTFRQVQPKHRGFPNPFLLDFFFLFDLVPLVPSVFFLFDGLVRLALTGLEVPSEDVFAELDTIFKVNDRSMIL